MIRLLMQLNPLPSLCPVRIRLRYIPAREREARKRNPSITSRPIWVDAPNQNNWHSLPFVAVKLAHRLNEHQLIPSAHPLNIRSRAFDLHMLELDSILEWVPLQSEEGRRKGLSVCLSTKTAAALSTSCRPTLQTSFV